MPLSDPARPTRIAMTTDSDVGVRQLIRRAAAAGERVAVYDNTGAWTMTSGSSRIWTTSDMSAQPARPPTMVVHNGNANPYPGAWISVTVGPASGGIPISRSISADGKSGWPPTDSGPSWRLSPSGTSRPTSTKDPRRPFLSILKLRVIFSSGMSSVCHFGHEREILGLTPRSGGLAWWLPVGPVVVPLDHCGTVSAVLIGVDPNSV